MPTTLTPPEIRRPNDAGDSGLGDRGIDDGNIGDIGGGKRPPIDKRTGGGGDGDGDDDWNRHPAGRRGPRDRITRYRRGLFFALGAVLIFFLAIVGSFLVVKHSSHVDAYGHYLNSWLPVELPPILWLTTVVLLLSSITAEVARRAMFHEHDVMEEWIGLTRRTTKRATHWLMATFGLGLLFLLGQWTAWLQLVAQQRSWNLQSSHFFYIFTGAHAAHLMLGIFALAAALIGLQRSRSLMTKQILVDVTVWYWHAMGALWLALFVLVEYFQ